MNRPSSLACVAGKPRVCLLLLILFATTVWGWYNGAVPWWMALLAVGAAQRALRSYHELKRYTAWRVQWEAMGPPNDRPAPALRAPAAAHKGLVAVAVLVAVGIPFYGTGGSDSVLGMWLAACMILVVELVRAVRRRSRNSGAKMSRPGKAEAADDSPVAWMLGRAASSPTRTDAEGNLPDYCARLGG